jgi:WD40 repeat protein
MTTESAGAEVEPDGLHALIDDLACVEFRGPGGKVQRIRRDYVILPHLQLVCRALWEEDGWRRADRPAFLADYVKKSRKGKDNPARKALRDFCAGCMEALTADQQRIAARAFDFLVTSQGAKMPYELTNLARHMSVPEGELENTLDKLSRDARILKKTEWQKERWYELYHDMYAPVIYEWKEHFDARVRREQAEESRAAVYDRRAVHAEARENSEEALVLRLKALETRDTDARRRQVSRVLDGMKALRMAFRHEGPVLAVALRADAKQVVTASAINAAESAAREQKSAKKAENRSLLQVWNADTGEPAGKPIEVEGTVRLLAMNADGSEVAAVVDGAVHLIDPQGSAPHRRAGLRRDYKRAQTTARLRFSPDGRFLTIEQRVPLAWGVLELERKPRFEWSAIRAKALAINYAAGIAAVQRDEYAVTIANLYSRQEIGHAHPGETITAFALSPDGTRVAIATADCVAAIWNVSTGDQEGPEFQLDSPAHRLAFGPERLIASMKDRKADWQPGLVRAWNLETGAAVGKPVPIASRRSWPPSVTFGPRAEYAVIRGRSTSRPSAILNTSTAELLELPWPGGPIEWSADGRFLLVGGADGVARMWSLAELNGLQHPVTHPAGIWQAALHPTARRVAVAAGDGSTLIQSGSGRTFRELPGHGKLAAWDRSGAHIAVVSGATVRIFDAATGEEQARTKTDEVDQVVFGVTGNGIALVNTYFSLRWWPWEAGKPPRRSLDLWETAFSRNGRVFAAFEEGEEKVQIHDGRTGKRLLGVKHEGGVRMLAMSPDGKLLLTGGEDGRALVWNSSRGEQLTVLSHQGPVAQAAVSPSGRLAATLGADQIARVWSIPEDRELGRIQYPGAAETLCFAPDEGMLFIASASWSHLFRIAAGITPHASRRLHGRWSGDFRFLKRDGSQMLALTTTPGLAYHVEEIDFDSVKSDPIQEKPLCSWEDRTALRFESEELVPKYLARAVAPIAGPPAVRRAKLRNGDAVPQEP